MICRQTVSLGAYLLGAMEPAERPVFEAHLHSCKTCRAELVRLSPLPGLLHHLVPEDFDELMADEPPLPRTRPAPPRVRVPPVYAPEPTTVSAGGPGAWQLFDDGDAAMAPQPMVGGRTGGEGGWRASGRRWLVAAVAVVVVALALGATLVFGAVEQPVQIAKPITWSATDARTGVRVMAELTGRPWGTELRLRLTGVPNGKRTCHLLVKGKNGNTEVAGRWSSGSGYSTETEIPGSTSVSIDDIDRLEVMAGDGLLVDIRAPK